VGGANWEIGNSGAHIAQWGQEWNESPSWATFTLRKGADYAIQNFLGFVKKGHGRHMVEDGEFFVMDLTKLKKGR